MGPKRKEPKASTQYTCTRMGSWGGRVVAFLLGGSARDSDHLRCDHTDGQAMRQRTGQWQGNGVSGTHGHHHPVLAQTWEEECLQASNTRKTQQVKGRLGNQDSSLHSLSQSPPEFRP